MPRPALSASRTAELLDLLAAHPDRSFSLSELSRRLDVNLASTHALVHALSRAGYVQRDERDRSWSLGPVLVVVGEAAARRNPLVGRARTALAEVAARHEAGGLLTALVEGELRVLQAVGSRARPGTTSGQRIPAVPPIGAIHVAHAGSEVADSWLASAPAAERDRYRTLLAEVREAGWVARHDRRLQPRLRRSLRRLQAEPHAAAVRAAVDAAVADLAHPSSVSTTLDAGGDHDLASLAALAHPDGHRPIGLYLVDLPPTLDGRRARSILDDLVAAAASLTAGSRPGAPDPAPGADRRHRRADATL